MRLKRLNICLIIGLMVSSILGIDTYGQQNVATPQASQNAVTNMVEESDGNITIEMPQTIMDYVIKGPAKPVPQQKVEQAPVEKKMKKGVNRTTGFRIQVFSDGRNQNTLESRARQRGSEILSRFPKYRGQVYTFSSSPNWYTRVGNFETSQEASAAMAELKRAFPGYAADMRVVKSQIVLVR